VITQTTVTSSFPDEVVRRIVEAVRPETVVLFGSRARGDSRPTSDIDILVIARSAEPDLEAAHACLAGERALDAVCFHAQQAAAIRGFVVSRMRRAERGES
jgi:predicted nucleotidyltransferase